MGTLRDSWVAFAVGFPLAAFGLFLLAAGATKPFPGFGGLLAAWGSFLMAMAAMNAWQVMRRRGPVRDDGPPD